MQDADSPAHVQAFPQPTRGRGPRVQAKPLRIVPCTEDLDGIAVRLGRKRDLGQKLTVRPAEPKLAVRPSIELVALFMDGAVMPAAEQREIRERGGAPLCLVTDVMALADTNQIGRASCRERV